MPGQKKKALGGEISYHFTRCNWERMTPKMRTGAFSTNEKLPVQENKSPIPRKGKKAKGAWRRAKTGTTITTPYKGRGPSANRTGGF